MQTGSTARRKSADSGMTLESANFEVKPEFTSGEILRSVSVSRIAVTTVSLEDLQGAVLLYKFLISAALYWPSF